MEADKTLMQWKYKRIIIQFSNRTGKTIEESMDYFYKSMTYDLISKGIGDMHCRSDIYLTDELLLEYGFNLHTGTIE